MCTLHNVTLVMCVSCEHQACFFLCVGIIAALCSASVHTRGEELPQRAEPGRCRCNVLKYVVKDSRGDTLCADNKNSSRLRHYVNDRWFYRRSEKERVSRTVISSLQTPEFKGANSQWPAFARAHIRCHRPCSTHAGAYLDTVPVPPTSACLTQTVFAVVNFAWEPQAPTPASQPRFVTCGQHVQGSDVVPCHDLPEA